MALQLQPRDLADAFTLAEINTEITAIKTAITLARQSKRDQFQDGQADQAVTRQGLEDLNNDLAVWVKALNIKNETDSSTAELIAGDYTGIHP